MLKQGRNAGEAQNVAIALASGRGFSDAYFAGSGPTAHLMPTTPAVAGGVFSLLGANSPLSEIVLQILAFGEIFGAFSLLYLAFARLGLPRWSAAGAFCFLCLVPLFLGQETLDFRYWEGGLALLLQACLFLWATGPTPFRGRAGVAIPAALASGTFIVSPQVGLASGGIVLFTAIHHGQLQRAMAAGFLSALMVACILGPWALRNEKMLGSPIPLRSNVWLELSLANNPAALNDEAAMRSEIARIHPSNSLKARADYQRMGEVAYFKSLERRTKAWIRAHPGTFLQLMVRHVRQMVLPSTWEFAIGGGIAARERAIIYGIVAVAGLIGILLGTMFLNRLFVLPLIHIAVLILFYAPFQPVQRYLYLNFAVFTYSAAIVAGVAAIWFKRQAMPTARALRAARGLATSPRMRGKLPLPSDSMADSCR